MRRREVAVARVAARPHALACKVERTVDRRKAVRLENDTDAAAVRNFVRVPEEAKPSDVGDCVRLEAAALPALEGALTAARAGVRTGGDPRNREFAGAHVSSDGVPDELLALAYDAQTAGGLLVTLPAEKALSLEAEFGRVGLFLARVGSVEEGAGVILES